jgi:hypothetical protein
MTTPTTREMLVEFQWLKRNPAFMERPASIEEFLGNHYLNIESGVREGVRECLVEIFGKKPNEYNIAEVQRAIFTGGIGIGKTTLASIALPYMVHWCLCLTDPQGFFGLLPGSRIAFMMMSTSEKQAKEVLFGDVFARINHSAWFKKYPYDPKLTTQIHFPKDIWIVPGDSSETTFEGYNILGGFVDEIDSHKVTEKKDYAEEGYSTIHSRITSRFQKRGLLILIGQMKRSMGFAARKFKEFNEEGKTGGAYAKKMAIWESLGWAQFLKPDGTRDSFWFDPKRKQLVPEIALDILGRENLIEIPNAYRKDFQNNPEKALRDHAGIPPIVGAAFISMIDRVEACRDKWHKRFGVDESPVMPNAVKPEFHSWFNATDTIRRVMHVDIGLTSDALGMAIGHVRELKEVDGELKPVIVFDALMRIKALPGRQVQLAEMRQIIYYLRDELGFRIKKVTLDGFESTDTMQQLTRKKIIGEYLSIDRNILPYHDLREAIYEGRCEFPRYMTYLRHGDVVQEEIAVRELLQLIEKETGKIDHPDGGSKDVSDAMAGVCTTLMGDRTYRRGLSSGVTNSPTSAAIGSTQVEVPGFSLSSTGSNGSLPSLPAMPDIGSLGSLLPSVPKHLRTR